jgi:hypothetical protein
LDVWINTTMENAKKWSRFLTILDFPFSVWLRMIINYDRIAMNFIGINELKENIKSEWKAERPGRFSKLKLNFYL